MKRTLMFLALAGWAAAQPVIQIQTTAWTSATATGSTLVVPTQQGAAASVFFTRAGTVSQGPVVAFEGSPQPDNQTGTDWFSVPCLAPTTNGTQYDLTSTANVAFQCNVVGLQRFRLRLTTPIGGTGTINATALITNASVPTTPNPTNTPPVTATISGTPTVNQGTSPWVTSASQGNQGTQPWFGMPALPPVTSGSTTVLTYYMPTPYTNNATATSNGSNNIKLTAANVWGYSVQNPNASVCWLQFYNSSAPSLGATRIYGVPIVASGGIAQILPAPINFSTALTIATTTADAGGTTCTTGMAVTIYYQ